MAKQSTLGQQVTEEAGGKIISLENERPMPGYGGMTKQEMIDRALDELNGLVDMIKAGKVRSVAIAMDLVDDRTFVSYPAGTFDPNLIASVAFLQKQLLEQG